MATLTSPADLGAVLKREYDRDYNRETVTLESGTDYPIGAVLGVITASGNYALSPHASTVGIEGAETAAAVLLVATDATSADTEAVVLVRGPAIVADTPLVVDASVDDATKLAAKHAQLVALGIVPRHTA